MNAAALSTDTGAILNGTFEIVDTTDPNFGWEIVGTLDFTDGTVILQEDGTFNTSLSQTFTIPDGATTLKFTILDTDFNSDPLEPDTLEVALLDANSSTPLVNTPIELTSTDAFLNLQNNGQLFLGDQISTPSGIESGNIANLNIPLVFNVDVSAIAAGTQATLFFDLLGFGAMDSTVVLDDIVLLSSPPTPPVANDDIAMTDEGSDVAIAVLNNDTDDIALAPSTVNLATPPSNGLATVNTDGTITYTPNANFIGNDSFTYTVQDDLGATSNPAQVTVTVNNVAPTITDLTGDTLINEGDEANFSVTATEPGDDTLTYSWSFGDGSPEVSGESVNHVFVDNGTYTLTVTVTDEAGGTSSASLDVQVDNLAPTVTAGPDQIVNEGDSVLFNGSFIDPGSQDTHTLEWNFGDGNSNNTLTPTHTYLDDGTYTATLSVTDNDGGTNSDSIIITVNNVAPTITSLNGNTTLFEDVLTSFTATATDPGNDTLTFTWNFGDGTTEVTGDNVEHQFAEPGQYAVTLTVDDGDGGTTQQSLNVTVQPLLPPSIEALQIPTALDEGTPTSFSVTAQDPANLDLTYRWDFGDGSDLVSEAMPTHRYADNGTYEVTVRVTNAAGRFTEQTQTVTVNNVAPTANSGPDQTVSEGETVQFKGAFNDPGVLDTHTVQWDFGDGTQATSLTPTHIYQQDGVYQATLTVTDNDGGVSSETLTVTVENIAPVIADTSGPITINEGESANFSVTATDPGSDALNYSWNFGDGSPDVSGRSLSHQFNQDGTYPVTVTVTDSDGASTSASFNVTVNNLAPTLQEVTGQSPIQEGDSAFFQATAIDPGNDALTYSWDFGDGSSMVSEQNPSHIYQDNGTYIATVTVTDSDGASSQQSVTIEVNNLSPTVEAGEDQTVNEGQLVQFIGTFSDPGVLDTHTIEWNFGDGNTSSGNLDPSHTYLDDGTYTATLSVTDNDGATGSDEVSIIVNNVAPMIEELDGPSTLNEGDSGQFSVLASDPGQDTLSYSWRFGDGTAAVQGREVDHTFTDNGTYTVTVTVTDDDGGVTQQEHTVTVNNLAPIVDAGPDQVIYLGETVQLNGTFQDPGADDTHSFRWNLGDGTTRSDTLTPTYTYQTEGIYAVSLTVLDDDQEFETDTLSVQVKQLPILSVADVVVQEDDDADVDALFTITLSEAGIRPVQVEFHTEDGTAIAGEDYEATSGQLTFQPGEIAKTVRVKVLGDRLVESPEQFQLLLSNPIDARIGASSAVGTIEDNDESAPLSINPIEGATSSVEGESLVWSVSAKDPNNQPLTYQWDFGDGSTPVEGQSVQHVFADDGTYTITVTVTNPDGDTAQTQSSITVTNATPQVDIDPVNEIVEGQTVSFNGSFTDPGSQDTHTLEWNFGDGTTESGTLTPSHTYTDDGTYTVTLTVTDKDNGTTTESLIVTVKNLAPAITGFTGMTQLREGETATFNATTLDLGADVLTTTWDFGDGTAIALGNQVSHLYEQQGSYTVSVTVTDDDGAATSKTFEVQVEPIAKAYDSVLFGSNFVKIGKRTQIQSGDVFVNDPFGRLKINKLTKTGSAVDVAANFLKLSKKVNISGDASFNTAKNRGTIQGTTFSPTSFPLQTENPFTFKPPSPGTQDIRVGKRQTLRLAPGHYDDILIKKGGTLIFDGPGIYHIDSIRGKKRSQILFDSNDVVEVRVQDWFKVSGRSKIGPTANATIDASSIVFYIEGQARPKRAAWFGKDSDIDANIFNLNGKLRIGRRSHATGSFFSPVIKVKRRVTLAYDSYFAEQFSQQRTLQITANLANDNGYLLDDRITSDFSLAGQILADHDIASFLFSPTGSSRNQAIDILSFLRDDGQFQISQTDLIRLLGHPLSDGFNQFTFWATDSSGQESQFELMFELDSLADQPLNSSETDTNSIQTGLFNRLLSWFKRR